MRGEIIVSGTILLSSIGLLHVATTFPQQDAADKVGPAFWPEVILLALIVLSGYLLLKNAVIFLKDRESSQQGAPTSDKEGPLKLMMVVMLTMIYGLGVPFVGFLISIFLFQVFLLLLLKVRTVLVVVFYPLGLTALLYAVFVKVLYIPLPRGEGIFLTFSRLFY